MRRIVALVFAAALILVPEIVLAETVIVRALRVHVVHRPGQLPAFVLIGSLGRVETFHASTVTVIWDYAYVGNQLQTGVLARVPVVGVEVIEVQPDP